MQKEPTNPKQSAETPSGIRHITLSQPDVHQLFNTMDLSPVHEKDPDADAAELILSWANEFHRPEPVAVIVHLEPLSSGRDAKHMMKQGSMSLLVGLSFLEACLLLLGLAARSSKS